MESVERRRSQTCYKYVKINLLTPIKKRLIIKYNFSYDYYKNSWSILEEIKEWFGKSFCFISLLEFLLFGIILCMIFLTCKNEQCIAAIK